MRKFWGYLLFLIILISGGLFLIIYLTFSSGKLSINREQIDFISKIHRIILTISYLSTLLIVLLEIYKKINSNPLIFVWAFIIQLPFLIYATYLIYLFPYVDRSFGFISESSINHGENSPLYFSITSWILVLLYLSFRINSKPFQPFFIIILLTFLIILRYISQTSQYISFNG